MVAAKMKAPKRWVVWNLASQRSGATKGRDAGPLNGPYSKEPIQGAHSLYSCSIINLPKNPVYSLSMVAAGVPSEAPVMQLSVIYKAVSTQKRIPHTEQSECSHPT